MTFYNRFSIKAKKSRLTWYLIFCFLFLITICVVYSFLKFSSSLEGEGIYHCNSTTCFLTTYFPLEIEKRLQTNQTILINNTEMKLDIAKIYDGDQLCGTAQLVLPMYGLGQNIPLNGICIDCCKPGKNYTAKFIAKNLWAMEK